MTKRCRSERLPLELAYLRTHDGREVDLLVEREAGFGAAEIKASERVGRSDARHLHGLEAFLDKPLLLGIVVSRDPECARLDDEGALWKVEASALLS